MTPLAAGHCLIAAQNGVGHCERRTPLTRAAIVPVLACINAERTRSRLCPRPLLPRLREMVTNGIRPRTDQGRGNQDLSTRPGRPARPESGDRHTEMPFVSDSQQLLLGSGPACRTADPARNRAPRTFTERDQCRQQATRLPGWRRSWAASQRGAPGPGRSRCTAVRLTSPDERSAVRSRGFRDT
jgi:hypothetical protein